MAPDGGSAAAAIAAVARSSAVSGHRQGSICPGPGEQSPHQSTAGAGLTLPALRHAYAQPSDQNVDRAEADLDFFAGKTLPKMQPVQPYSSGALRTPSNESASGNTAGEVDKLLYPERLSKDAQSADLDLQQKENALKQSVEYLSSVVRGLRDRELQQKLDAQQVQAELEKFKRKEKALMQQLSEAERQKQHHQVQKAKLEKIVSAHEEKEKKMQDKERLLVEENQKQQERITELEQERESLFHEIKQLQMRITQQEHRIEKQDEKIARQDDKISELQEVVAEELKSQREQMAAMFSAFKSSTTAHQSCGTTTHARQEATALPSAVFGVQETTIPIVAGSLELSAVHRSNPALPEPDGQSQQETQRASETTARMSMADYAWHCEQMAVKYILSPSEDHCNDLVSENTSLQQVVDVLHGEPKSAQGHHGNGTNTSKSAHVDHDNTLHTARCRMSEIPGLGCGSPMLLLEHIKIARAYGAEHRIEPLPDCSSQDHYESVYMVIKQLGSSAETVHLAEALNSCFAVEKFCEGATRYS